MRHRVASADKPLSRLPSLLSLSRQPDFSTGRCWILSRSDSWRINELTENASDMLEKGLEKASRYGSSSDF